MLHNYITLMPSSINRRDFDTYWYYDISLHALGAGKATAFPRYLHLIISRLLSGRDYAYTICFDAFINFSPQLAARDYIMAYARTSISLFNIHCTVIIDRAFSSFPPIGVVDVAITRWTKLTIHYRRAWLSCYTACDAHYDITGKIYRHGE